MNLNHLKKFAQGARRKLMGEVSSRLEYLLGHDDAYIRANETHIEEIRRRLKQKEREQLVEEVAYTWFNRIVALRFMDLRGYTKTRIVSPQAVQVQPELLYQIKQGRTPKALHSLQDTFNAYLEGRITSDQPDREIYTAALLGMCNDYTNTLPFLFRRVDEYMAVLLPTDLLSENSILADVQNAITEDEVEDVEVIGWLYQFYISEKKDQVFARPKGEKIKKEDIPAATQLFTPHWIVRYMVENSLGRLWRNNFPATRVSEQMDYYIEGDPEPDYLKISGPEEITLLDPACGSGHILTYAFDLLYAMYEEAGYTPSEIPSLILQNNLYGIDIDTRAAELAAFALTMKAREKDRFFFQRGVEPNVIAMEDVELDLRDAGIAMSPKLQEAFGYLAEATNFGSLIPVPAEVQGEIEDILAELDAKGDADLFADQAMAQVRGGLRQLGYLARRYHCVVTNPPYMGAKAMNENAKGFYSRNYPTGKNDVYACFVLKSISQSLARGYQALITMQSWMFLSTFEEFRSYTIHESPIVALAHLGERAFDTISGAVVSTVAFILAKGVRRMDGTFIRLVDGKSEGEKQASLRDAIEGRAKSRVYFREMGDFGSIAGNPIAYWLSDRILELVKQSPAFSEKLDSKQGLATADDQRFIRNWFEVSRTRIGFDMSSTGEAYASGLKWFPINKGGSYRRWYGNQELVVNWERDGEEVKKYVDHRYPYLKGNIDYVIKDRGRYFQRSISWSDIQSSSNAFRYYPAGFLYSHKGNSAFTSSVPDLMVALAFCNSVIVKETMASLSPGVSFPIGYFDRLPWPEKAEDNEELVRIARLAVSISKECWDSREVSWEFARSPLLSSYVGEPSSTQSDPVIEEFKWPRMPRLKSSLSEAFRGYSRHIRERIATLKSLEERNNEVFVQLYGLSAELIPAIGLDSITIYQSELEAGAQKSGQVSIDNEEIMSQFVSYGVGCIFGRYSLDEDGLILANAGDTLDTYLERIPEPRLRPDESGILPITEDDNFPDDLPSQFRAFLRAAFGTQHYDENVQFLEEGLGRDLRSYFLKDFYKDHVKRYKKRPIYWLITSPKGSLRALIYLHRYNRDTVNRFLNDYLRPYQRKLEARRRTAEQSLNSGGLSGSERTKARKDIDRISAALEELSVWERDVVRPLAEQRVELDLDDGVKVNYGKLGAILETVKGLNG